MDENTKLGPRADKGLKNCVSGMCALKLLHLQMYPRVPENFLLIFHTYMFKMIEYI